ncbi:CinA family protein [Thalassovita sp.]|uniref:CinA family protein n=1 Tax=Thalassovita sp. TaxID=1979401 RepID=UPI002B27B45B|nr:CinA family protein [Thalassovita sp.]
MSAASDILDRYRALGLHIAAAESCTGGMVMAALTDVPGSSDVVDRGFVTYTNAAKVQMLGVSQATLDAHGAVSEQVAREMAEGALARSESNVAVAVTGIAGPGGSDFKPEGRVCFGIAVKGRATATETVEFGPLGRAEVRARSVQKSLKLLLNAADN